MHAAARGAFAALALFMIFFSVALLDNATEISESNGSTWLLAVGLPCVVITGLIRSYRWIRVRLSGRQHETTMRAVVSAPTFGLMFGLMLVLSIELFGLDPAHSHVLTVATFTVSVGVVGIAVAVFENNWIAENVRRKRLLEEGISLALAQQDMVNINERLRLALSTKIDAALAPARLQIEERIIDEQQSIHSDEWEVIAAQLRSAADDTVRPLSRHLWSRTVARTSPIRVGWILRNIVTKQSFQVVALATIYVVTSLSRAITDFGWARGLLLLLCGVIAICVLLGGANTAMRRWPQHHAVIFVSAVVALQAIGLLNFELRAAVGTRYTWAQFASEVVFGVLLILLTSGIGSIRTHREDVARTFQSDLDRKLIQSIAASRQSAQLARESARILHGTVQTRLVACAIAIEHAAEVDDAEAFRAALHEAQQILESPIQGRDALETTITEEVQRKVGLWVGLCSIDVAMSPQVAAMDGRLARDVGRVVEEGLSNAIRHGRAKAITVRVELTETHVGEGVVVVVEDNGSGPGDGERGLGSSMLDAVSSSWELSALEPGSRLRVSL